MVTKSVHHSDEKSELQSVQELVSRSERSSENSSDEALHRILTVRKLVARLEWWKAGQWVTNSAAKLDDPLGIVLDQY